MITMVALSLLIPLSPLAYAFGLRLVPSACASALPSGTPGLRLGLPLGTLSGWKKGSTPTNSKNAENRDFFDFFLHFIVLI